MIPRQEIEQKIKDFKVLQFNYNESLNYFYDRIWDIHIVYKNNDMARGHLDSYNFVGDNIEVGAELPDGCLYTYNIPVADLWTSLEDIEARILLEKEDARTEKQRQADAQKEAEEKEYQLYLKLKAKYE